MAPKKPPLSLRRASDSIDPLQAERFVRGLSDEPPSRAPLTAPVPPLVAAPARHPDVQTPERLSVQTSVEPARTQESPSKSLVYRKRTDDHRRRMTVYLPEDLSRRLRLYAAERDQDYSVVLAEALEALLDRKNTR